jgi:hypothetical protein
LFTFFHHKEKKSTKGANFLWAEGRKGEDVITVNQELDLVEREENG